MVKTQRLAKDANPDAAKAATGRPSGAASAESRSRTPRARASGTPKSSQDKAQKQAALAQRLVESALEQFGQHGFDGASTREIARASGTAMSSITYHFGSKQGLYLACADYIGDQIQAIHTDGLAAIGANPPKDAETARAALIGLLQNFARMMLAPRSEAWSQYIVREQQRPTEAFERLYERIMRPMLDVAIGLIAIARPSLDDTARRTLVMNIVGMALVLRLGRACVSRVMLVEDIDEATAETLIAGICRSALALLTETKA